jgi:hypothetical protein
MKKEKTLQNIEWVAHENFHFRIQKKHDNTATLWASVSGKDLCFSLIFYDFLERCYDRINIQIKMDTSWNDWRGFTVNQSEVNLLIQEILNFVVEWEIEANENEVAISDEQWYAV